MQNSTYIFGVIGQSHNGSVKIAKQLIDVASKPVLGDWLRGYLKPELEHYCEPQFLKEQAIFNLDEIKELVGNHLSGKIDNTFRVWTFFCFQKWYKNTYSKI